MPDSFDVLVIGGGGAGYAAASTAARLRQSRGNQQRIVELAGRGQDGSNVVRTNTWPSWTRVSMTGSGGSGSR